MKVAILLFAVVTCVGVAGEARAARASSYNDVYFDAQGQIVGQDLIGCSNAHWRGGNTSAPYKLSVEVNCDGSPRECPGWLSVCATDWSKTIEYSLYPVPAPLSLDQACAAAPVCDSPEPNVLLNTSFEIKRVYGNN